MITLATELHVWIPTGDDWSFSQWYERWGQGGIVRRCDGMTCQFTVVEAGQEPQRDVPCTCKAQELPEEGRCDPTTRLNVVAEELFMLPRMGLWQVTSRGWDSTREIAAAIELLRASGNVVGIPLLLRVEQRTRRARDGKSYTFPVFTLVPMVSFQDAVRVAQERPQPFALSSGAPPAPPPPALATGTSTVAERPVEPVKTSVVPADMAPYLRKEPTGETECEQIANLRSVCREYTTTPNGSGTPTPIWP
ncbi:MAG TPA: hypothetical protein VNN19_01380 [bacterium]|nr:hypothetical protein [bacterium]